MYRTFPLLLALPLFAASQGASIESLQQRVDHMRGQTVLGQTMAMPAPVPKETENHLSFGFDLLYWYARGGGTFINPYVRTKSVYDTNTYPNRGRNKVNPLTADLGFRVSGSYLLPYDNWQLSLDYTRLVFAKSVATGGLAFTLEASPSYSEGWTNSLTSLVKSSIHGKYQALNLAFSQAYYVAKTLSLSPLFGTRAVRFSYTKNVRAEGSSLTNDEDKGARYFETGSFQSIGPQVGLGTEWHLPKGWSLNANLRATLFVLTAGLQIDNSSPNAPEKASTVKSNARAPRTQYISQLGLNYHRVFRDEKKYLDCGIGYEAQTITGGLPSFFGLTLKAQLGF